MSRMPHNIDRSTVRKGEYVLYLHGSQRVTGRKGAWRTAGLCSLTGSPVYATGRTLQELATNAARIARDAGL